MSNLKAFSEDANECFSVSYLHFQLIFTQCKSFSCLKITINCVATFHFALCGLLMWEALHLSGFKVADWFGQVDISQQDILFFWRVHKSGLNILIFPLGLLRTRCPHTHSTHTLHTHAHTHWSANQLM